MSKISSLCSMLKCNFVQLGIFHELLSVDGSMVPYFGRHRAKMFISGKPVRFGCKIWRLSVSDGWLLHAGTVYQEKQSNAIDQPLKAPVNNNEVFIISSNSNVLYHQLYFDNFFTSYYSITELAEKSMRATETIPEKKTRFYSQTMSR